MWLVSFSGAPLQRTHWGKPKQIIAEICLLLLCQQRDQSLAANQTDYSSAVAVYQFPLSAKSKKLIDISNHRIPFQWELLAMYVNGLSAISSLQWEPHGYRNATFGFINPLKIAFCDPKRDFPLILKVQFQLFNINKGLSTGIIL
jgi:hypothetical protein